MIEALLLAAAEPSMTAIDAERAFAADAQKFGQWTAFRKWSTPDAVMFAPNPVNAQNFLKDKANPPVAVFWWPGESYVSCDGGTAINTGSWVRQGGKSVGYFTTVWKRQSDGSWKWIYAAGDMLKGLRAEGGDIQPITASCATPPPPFPIHPVTSGEPRVDEGASADGTLIWMWWAEWNGPRKFSAYLWNGREWELMIDDKVDPTR